MFSRNLKKTNQEISQDYVQEYVNDIERISIVCIFVCSSAINEKIFFK